MNEIFQKLAEPFPVDEIEWRVGATTKDKSKGIALAYIDARAVMDRLDKVVGPNNWQCRYPHANGKTCCEIGIRAATTTKLLVQPEPLEQVEWGDWVWKSDGAGDTDYEGAKGAFSDAFKRAAVRWGIGRYLYELDAPWVKIEPAGKTYKIADEAIKQLRQKYTQRVMPIMEMKDRCKEAIAKINDAPDIPSLTDIIEEYDQFWTQLSIGLPSWKERVDQVIADREIQLDPGRIA